MQHLYGKQKSNIDRNLIAAIAVFVAALAVFFVLLSGTREKAETRQQALLEQAIRDAAVTCYAIEGRYPASLEYIMEHYGLAIDLSAYAVRYEVFAENLMPEISVVRRGAGG